MHRPPWVYVVSAVTAAFVTIATATLAIAASTALPASSTGYDISWPQCNSAFPPSPGFGIVGVNDGAPFTVNKCLDRELRWAQGGVNPVPAFYLNSGNGGWHVYTGPNTVGATLTVTELIATKLLVGSSTASVTRILTGLGTLSFSITPANSTQDQTFAVTGAQAGDAVQIGWLTSPPAGVGFSGFMAAAGTVSLRLTNPSTVTIGAASVTVRAAVTGFT